MIISFSAFVLALAILVAGVLYDNHRKRRVSARPATVTPLYSDAELALIRQRLRNGNADAREIAKARGYTLDPRIRAAVGP